MLEELPEAYRRSLLRELYAMVGHDAEDVLQEAMLNAYLTSSFDGRAKWTSWFWTVARHAAFDHLRKMNRRPHGSSVPIPQYAEERWAAPSDAWQLRIELEEQLRCLPPDQATLLLMNARLGDKALGKLLGINPKTLRGRLHRIRQSLITQKPVGLKALRVV